MDYKKIRFPYGREEIDVKIPSNNLIEVIETIDPEGVENEKAEIERSLNEPIGTEPLEDMVNPDDKVVIIISDKTRPVPNDVIVPTVLGILEKKGLGPEDIKILIALGMHKKMDQDEIISMLGEGIPKKYDVINHECFDKDRLTYIGETSDGTKIEINNHVADADLIISIGYIEPHEFTGFTGGRKSILPGVSGIDAPKWNHRVELLDNPNSKPGIIENNPIHEDMLEACDMAGLDFIINVVLNSRNEIAKAFAGDFREAHQAGVDFYKEYSQIGVKEKADIVIASLGYPVNQDLYQSLKAVFASEPLVKDDGQIIVITKCEAGIGPDLFEEWMTTVSSFEEFSPKIKEEGYSPKIDHCYLLANILKDFDVIVVSPHPTLEKMDVLESVKKPSEAIDIALKRMGEDAKIIAVPYSTRVIVECYRQK